MFKRLPLFPVTTEVNKQGHLVVGGCDTVTLAAEFGTPLYLFDEVNLRKKCREFREEFGKRYPSSFIIYASKAYTNGVLLRLINEEGLGLDVVSEGELGIARSVKFPMQKVYLHGSNKSQRELELALEWHVGRIVVDNFYELEMLGKLVKKQGVKQDILLRMTPGVDPQTHRYTNTGSLDSKFGFPLPLKEEAVARALKIRGLNVLGLHFHIGSLIYETEPYVESIKSVLKFAVEMRQKYGLELKELDTGGGFGVQYTLDKPAPSTAVFAEKITATIIKECKKLGLELPKLIVEPGREIVAQSAVALYTIGVVKDIPGVRTYASVDGGMADNIRPALYGARLEAVLAMRMRARDAGEVTIAGKFCESGDILIRDIMMPRMVAGDILAVAGAGAYSLPESMNYNAYFKPAVIMVNNGKARLIRRRETLEDITRCDIL
ncbi:MAG: diaminopimelate decarboxylase [Dehalococcoidales bacterium]|nr:diaminopimelate decarboxylase [Dehalococcoidales bacterium]